MRNRIIKLAAVPFTAAVLALGGAGIASAGNFAPHAASDGTSGIEALHGNSVRNIGATVVTDPAALNIGGVGTGGIGTQLCDPNTGQGLQLGLTSNGTTFTVEYDAGVLTGAAKYVCEGNGVLTSPAPKPLNMNLTGIAQGDTVLLYTSFRNVKVWKFYRHHWHSHFEGRATFQAYDQTTGAGPYTAYVHTAPMWNLDSAGAGVQQNTTLVSACTPTIPEGSPVPTTGTVNPFLDGPTNEVYAGGAGACNGVAEFSNVFTNGPFGIFGSGPGLTETGQWNEVYTTGGGLPGNADVVGTNDTLYPDTQSFSPSAFDVFAGQVVG